MIYSLKGIVEELNPTHAVIEVNGVGYLVGLSLQSSSNLRVEKEAHLFIQQVIREDAHLLYGFYTRDERDLFNLLISVNGVGPSSAILMLSSLSNEDIANAIMEKNSGVLQKVKGIGAKTAERIIVDLHDKMEKFVQEDREIIAGNLLGNKVKNEALQALEVLGVGRKVAEKIADIVIKSNQEITVEELIRQILKRL